MVPSEEGGTGILKSSGFWSSTESPLEPWRCGTSRCPLIGCRSPAFGARSPRRLQYGPAWLWYSLFSAGCGGSAPRPLVMSGRWHFQRAAAAAKRGPAGLGRLPAHRRASRESLRPWGRLGWGCGGGGADAAAAMLDWRDARSQRSPSANPGGSASSPRSLGPVLGTRGDVLLPGEGVWIGGRRPLRHRRGGGSPWLEHRPERIGASGSPLRLRSFSEASGQSSRRLVPQFPHPWRGAGPSWLTHSSGGGLDALGALLNDVAWHEILHTCRHSLRTSLPDSRWGCLRIIPLHPSLSSSPLQLFISCTSLKVSPVYYWWAFVGPCGIYVETYRPKERQSSIKHFKLTEAPPLCEREKEALVLSGQPV